MSNRVSRRFSVTAPVLPAEVCVLGLAASSSPSSGLVWPSTTPHESGPVPALAALQPLRLSSSDIAEFGIAADGAAIGSGLLARQRRGASRRHALGSSVRLP